MFAYTTQKYLAHAFDSVHEKPNIRIAAHRPWKMMGWPWKRAKNNQFEWKETKVKTGQDCGEAWAPGRYREASAMEEWTQKGVHRNRYVRCCSAWHFEKLES